MVNPIARGLDEVEFDDYPLLPKLTKATCKLNKADVLPYVRVLSSALTKLPALVGTERLWRGHRRSVSYELGSIITLNGFTSVSRDRTAAIEFAAKANEGRSAQRTLLVFDEGKSFSHLTHALKWWQHLKVRKRMTWLCKLLRSA